MVLRPTVERTQLKHIEFVALEGRRVLSVLVSRSGAVSHRMFLLDDDVKQEDLDGVGRYLTEEFSGCTLVQIRARLLEMMAEEKALYDKLLARVIMVGKQTFQEDDAEPDGVLMGGAFHLVGQPEFSDSQRMRELFSAFEEKGRLVTCRAACWNSGSTRKAPITSRSSPRTRPSCFIARAAGARRSPPRRRRIWGLPPSPTWPAA